MPYVELSQAIPTILILVALEGLLSADNAMVLAIMVRPLPPELRRKALLYGIIGAYFLRGLALLFATIIIQFWWIQAIGSLYLIYLTAKHFRSKAGPKKEAEPAEVAARSFWRVVVMINFVDLAFAIDSVLVVVAFTNVLWVIFVGVAIGILLIRLAAGWFVEMIERYPLLEDMAYVMVGWAGLKLAIEAWGHFSEVVLHHPEWALHVPQAVFLIITFGIMVVGGWLAVRRPAQV